MPSLSVVPNVQNEALPMFFVGKRMFDPGVRALTLYALMRPASVSTTQSNPPESKVIWLGSTRPPVNVDVGATLPEAPTPENSMICAAFPPHEQPLVNELSCVTKIFLLASTAMPLMLSSRVVELPEMVAAGKAF